MKGRNRLMEPAAYCHSMYHRLMDAVLDVTAFILAGGKSTRMGRDKAFIDLDGRTLLSRAFELVHSVTPNLRIVGSSEKFAAFAPVVVEDVFSGRGPLGGIHAALQSSSTDLNLMLAVDTPFVTAAFLRYLIDQARNTPQAMVVVPRAGGNWQPLCAVYRRQFMTGAEDALSAGRNKIDRLFHDVRIKTIREKEMRNAGFSENMFRNLNTPEELEAERRAG